MRFLGLVIDTANPRFIAPGAGGGGEVEHVSPNWFVSAPCGGGVWLPHRAWCQTGGALIRRGASSLAGFEVVCGYRYLGADVKLPGVVGLEEGAALVEAAAKPGRRLKDTGDISPNDGFGIFFFLAGSCGEVGGRTRLGREMHAPSMPGG